MRRHIFALMRIGAWNEEAVKTTAGEFGSEKRRMRSTTGRITEIIKGLEHGRKIISRQHPIKLDIYSA
ncbi:hypothetical protein LAB1_09940 [Roseibium sp. LAB1]